MLETARTAPIGMRLRQPGRDGVAALGISAGAVVAGLAAMSCCVLPLAFFMLGISGAWIANFTALAPYKLIFEGLAGAFLIVGLVRVRRRTAACRDGSCALPVSDRLLKGALWASAVMIALALAYPYVAPALLAGLS